MNREKLLYGCIGLLLGLIIGYWGADSLNRSFAPPPPAAAATANPHAAQ